MVTNVKRRGLSLVVRDPESTDAELLPAMRSDPGVFALFYDRYEASILVTSCGAPRT